MATQARLAELLTDLPNHSPALLAARRVASPVTQQPAVVGGAKYWRERCEVAECASEHINNLRNEANRRARVAESSLHYAMAKAKAAHANVKVAKFSERSWREELQELQDRTAKDRAVVDALPVVGREARSGRGQQRWPLRIVQLILEQLVNGTPPSAIPDNIRSMALALGIKVAATPSVGFCHDMRIVLRILTETLAAYQLGKAAQRQQLSCDGTSRRQVQLIALEGADGLLRPLILSCAHIVEGETSEQTCAAALAEIKRGGARLRRWAEVH